MDGFDVTCCSARLKAWSKHPKDGAGRREARLDPATLEAAAREHEAGVEVKSEHEAKEMARQRRSTVSSKASEGSHVEHRGMETEMAMADQVRVLFPYDFCLQP